MANKEELRALQGEINRYRDVVDLEPIATDGIIGPKSLAALKAIHAALVAKNPALKVAPFPPPETAAIVAEQAPVIRQWLRDSGKVLGLPPLRTYDRGEGKEWNTKNEIAYGAGPVHEEFRGLQVDINKLASIVGFKPLELDGFIGKHTVDAIKKIYDAMVAKNPVYTATPFPLPDDKETVAEYASYIRFWLERVASKALKAEAGV